MAEYIYLNNGSVLTGKILSNNGNVVHILSDGKEYSYNVAEINRISNDADINMPTEQNLGNKVPVYSEFEKGFFFATELNAGYSLNLTKANMGYTELDVIGGYRFNEYLRIGAGMGPRLYIGAGERYAKSKLGFSLYANVRGNFIQSLYRDIVPYYSVDFGPSFPDGLMWRPAVGIRVGSKRSALLIALTYTGQNLRISEIKNDKALKAHKYTSFIGVKVGYEY